MTNIIHKLDDRIYLIDGHDLHLENRTGTYVLLEQEITLIETGPSLSIPYIKDGLKQLNINLSDIKHIIVTHIHLDHAGGLGLLLQDCPNATAYVHPKGARHLIDPSRLIAGARAVYGDQFDQWFAPIIPVPSDRLVVKEDRDTLQISETCTLTFYHTKGHADHHFSIYDPISNGIFTGDTLGVSYDAMLKDLQIHFYLPSTSPNQFRPDEMLKSLELVRNLDVDAIYFGHFSVVRNVDEVYKQIETFLPQFMEIGEKAFHENLDIDWVAKQLFELAKDYLSKQGVPSDHPIFQILKIDLNVCAIGIMDYLNKRK